MVHKLNSYNYRFAERYIIVAFTIKDGHNR
jgi:hypothetical protein